MVLDKPPEEADGLHTETPGHPVRAAASMVVPTVGPDWDRNAGGGLKLEHYGDCIFAGLGRGVTKQKCFNKVQEIKQKPSKGPSEFL